MRSFSIVLTSSFVCEVNISIGYQKQNLMAISSRVDLSFEGTKKPGPYMAKNKLMS